MSEIKFRAWDKTEKLMARNIEELSFNSKGLYGVILNHLGFVFKRRPKDTVLMQYIGFEDMGGQEIYDEDILRVMSKSSNYANVVYEMNLRVFQDNTGAWRVKYPNGTLESVFHIRNKVKVIGNIFENPELLEVDGRE